MKKLVAFILSIALASVVMTGCKKAEKTEQPEETQKPQGEVVQDSDAVYENKIFFSIEMESGEVMKGELYPDLAPETVENFVKLCEKNFYDGLIFHRVIPGFMIQGGGFTEEYKNKKASEIKGEFSSNGFENPLSHTRGVLSMARTMISNDSASSQFFIMHKDYPGLDGDYAAFGKVTEGLEVVDKIATTKVKIIPELGMENVPVEAQVIKTITILE